jgi:hypothetical protein
MSGLSRRDLLKGAAAATGAAWAAPLLFSSSASAHSPWDSTTHASGSGCACGDGIIVYAKFAPGNAQTCQNQCLQPGPEVIRLPWKCLVDNEIVKVCDEVESSDDYASLNFFKGTRPLRVAIKSENDCLIARCNEGFHQIYKWAASYNCEDFPENPCDKKGQTAFDPTHYYQDPATLAKDGIFRVFSGEGNPAALVPCKGNQLNNGLLEPRGDHAGGTAFEDAPFYGQVTGIALNTANISSQNDKLNFIEFELCIPNASKLPCDQNMCKETTTTTTA